MEFNTDIAIIGAGPTGLFTVFEAGMLKMKSVVIDALDFSGGQCTALYPEKPIYDIPAYPMISAEDLVKKLEEQARPFAPEYLFGQQVIALEGAVGKYVLTTSKGNKVKAKVIVIAAGCGAFGPNRPPLENLEEYEGKSIFYMVGKRDEFAGKNIVIAGGGDSAIDWTLSLSEVASKIYLVHRRDKFRCAPESYERVKEIAKTGKVELVIPYQLDSLEGKNGRLENVVVSDLDGAKKSLKADCLLPFFGLAMELGPIKDFGLGLDHNHIVVEPSTMETNLEGVFAIGDAAKYPGKLKLILTGFAEGALACHNSYKYVNDGKPLHFEYSTSKGVANI